jgi:hypothetical protein
MDKNFSHAKAQSRQEEVSQIAGGLPLRLCAFA